MDESSIGTVILVGRSYTSHHHLATAAAVVEPHGDCPFWAKPPGVNNSPTARMLMPHHRPLPPLCRRQHATPTLSMPHAMSPPRTLHYQRATTTMWVCCAITLTPPLIQGCGCYNK